MANRPLSEDHPTVAEVREWRARVVKDAGGTLDGLIALLHETPEPRARSTSQKDREPSGGRGARESRKKRSA